MNIASEPEAVGTKSLPISSFTLPADFKRKKTLSVCVIEAGDLLWEGVAESIIFPSPEGEMGILRGHIAINTSLTLGVLRIRTNGYFLSLFIVGGWAQVEGDEVLVRAMGAEWANDIDCQQAQADLATAREIFQQAQSQGERLRAGSAIKKAQVRLRAAQSLSSKQSRQPAPVVESRFSREFLPAQFSQPVLES